jgi:hypothetical protein
MTAILLADGLVTLAIKVYGSLKDDPGTPEEIQARAEAAFAKLTLVEQAVAGYQPVPKPD